MRQNRNSKRLLLYEKSALSSTLILLCPIHFYRIIPCRVFGKDNQKNDDTVLKKEKISELKTPITACNIADKEDFLLEKLAQDNKE